MDDIITPVDTLRLCQHGFRTVFQPAAFSVHDMNILLVSLMLQFKWSDT